MKKPNITAAGRGRLDYRSDPYWHVLRSRCALGYRVPKLDAGRSEESTWVDRWRESHGGKKHRRGALR